MRVLVAVALLFAVTLGVPWLLLRWTGSWVPAGLAGGAGLVAVFVMLRKRLAGSGGGDLPGTYVPMGSDGWDAGGDGGDGDAGGGGGGD